MTSVVDKHGVLDQMDGAKLDLGCGSRKRASDYIGVDMIDHAAVDIVGDVFDVLTRIPDESLDRVYSSHFMEHVDDLPHLMHELARVLRPNCCLETVVPHFSNPYFYSDATHRTSFGLYSMSYFSTGSPFKRSVPVYEGKPLFQLQDVRLVFKAPRPFYGRYAFAKLVEQLVNLSRSTQEFYEGYGSHWFPCYELEFFMTRLPEPTSAGGSANSTRD
jgi:ubiquinone/menaquinone biosynthesis C-methylase UbiE